MPACVTGRLTATKSRQLCSFSARVYAGTRGKSSAPFRWCQVGGVPGVGCVGGTRGWAFPGSSLEGDRTDIPRSQLRLAPRAVVTQLATALPCGQLPTICSRLRSPLLQQTCVVCCHSSPREETPLSLVISEAHRAHALPCAPSIDRLPHCLPCVHGDRRLLHLACLHGVRSPMLRGLGAAGQVAPLHALLRPVVRSPARPDGVLLSGLFTIDVCRHAPVGPTGSSRQPSHTGRPRRSHTRPETRRPA
jgi:hypothetical protein